MTGGIDFIFQLIVLIIYFFNKPVVSTIKGWFYF